MREEYEKVATEVKSVEGAESKYRVAEIDYINKDYEQAEKEIFGFADMNTPHQYWMAKAFILLADVYLAREDDFQASATLQSIIDYYEKSDDGILDLARRKKADIEKRQLEQENNPGKEEPEIEINPRPGDSIQGNGSQSSQVQRFEGVQVQRFQVFKGGLP